MARAIGESAKQIALIFHVVKTKAADDTRTKPVASRMDIAPRGSSRFAVRGFSASWRASTSRLNPMAALRAVTIAARIQKRRPAESALASRCSASSAPASANGSANTEWPMRTNDM